MYKRQIPVLELSKKLSIPERTVAFRIKQLEKKGVIQGYRALFNLDLIGYETFKVDFFLRSISGLSSFIEYAHRHPNIIYVDQTIGGSDFEIDIEIENKSLFEMLMDELRTEFPEIRNWFYFTIRKYITNIYFPKING